MRKTPLLTLRRFAGSRRAADAPARAEEQCELCSRPLAPEHRHLLQMETRRVVCACDPCALRFHDVVDGRFKLIPRDVIALPDLEIGDAQWDRLAVPIDLAFFVRSTARDRVVALYPSPAGVTESLLPLDAWSELASAHDALAAMEPDVEALLVNRVKATRAYFLAPIDVCFQLTGLVRLHWRGLSGGTVVWREIDRFFDQLNRRARLPRSRHA